MTPPRRRVVLVGLGVVGLVVCAIAGVVRPDDFFRAWLAAVVFWVGLSLGALMLLMAHDLTGGRWGIAARPPLEAVAAMLPLGALMFVPLLFGLAHLYPWARAAEAASLPNRFYLNSGFFAARAVLYFVLWLGVAALTLRPASRDPDGRPVGRLTSAPGLIVLGITVTFSAFDWTMSLEPHWSSSIYGLFVTASDLVAALAVATFIVAGASAVPAPRRTPDGPTTLGDLASLLFAGIMLWTYLGIMQFVIIWQSDLLDEIGWYLRRIADGWRGITYAVIATGTLVPFAILIWWPLKQRPGWVRLACVSLLVGYGLTRWWLIFPATAGGLPWLAPVALVATGGFWLSLFDLRLERGHLFGRVRRAPLAGGSHV